MTRRSVRAIVVSAADRGRNRGAGMDGNRATTGTTRADAMRAQTTQADEVRAGGTRAGATRAGAAPSPHTRSATPARRMVGAVASVAIGSAVVNVGVAYAAMALGSPVTPQLGVPGVVTISVATAVAAVVGWAIVRRRARDPRAMLRRLVPIVLLASFVPDVLLGVATAEATGWAPVVALAVMHVTTAVVAVAVCSRLLPLEPAPAASAAPARVAAA
jgi:hypothetical protein